MKKFLSAVVVVAFTIGISSSVCLSLRLSEYYVGELNGNKVYLLTQFISNHTRMETPLKTRWGAMLSVKNGDKKIKTIHLEFGHENDGWYYSDSVYEFKRYKVTPKDNSIYGRTLDYILNKR